MQFKKLPWKYDEGFGIGGAWYADLVVRFFIFPPRGGSGKFKASIGFDRKIGEYATLDAAKAGSQAALKALDFLTAIADFCDRCLMEKATAEFARRLDAASTAITQPKCSCRGVYTCNTVT